MCFPLVNRTNHSQYYLISSGKTRVRNQQNQGSNLQHLIFQQEAWRLTSKAKRCECWTHYSNKFLSLILWCIFSCSFILTYLSRVQISGFYVPFNQPCFPNLFVSCNLHHLLTSINPVLISLTSKTNLLSNSKLLSSQDTSNQIDPGSPRLWGQYCDENAMFSPCTDFQWCTWCLPCKHLTSLTCFKWWYQSCQKPNSNANPIACSQISTSEHGAAYI